MGVFLERAELDLLIDVLNKSGRLMASVPCGSCWRDWGHGHCGVCGGMGTVKEANTVAQRTLQKLKNAVEEGMQPSAKFVKLAVKLFRQEDGWLSPTMEYKEPESRTDYGNFEREERAGWEETCHFSELYGDQLRDLSEQAAAEAGFNPANYQEPVLAMRELFYEPLLDAFWEEWAMRHKLAERWEKEIKNGAVKV